MQLLDDLVPELRERLRTLRPSTCFREVAVNGLAPWPQARKGAVVLKADTAVELGGPDDVSVAFLLWTESSSLVEHGRVTLAGPDVQDRAATTLPLAKVALVEVEGFTEESCRERCRELDLVRFDLNLEGYMMRAVSQRAREWSRVAHRAVDSGLSLFNLGAALIRRYTLIPWVKGAELVFVTSSGDDVLALAPLAEQAVTRVAALDKMTSELETECESCEFNDVCSDVEELRRLRRSRLKGRADA